MLPRNIAFIDRRICRHCRRLIRTTTRFVVMAIIAVRRSRSIVASTTISTFAIIGDRFVTVATTTTSAILTRK
uniref:Secreted peptide n=1 Tax=Romanomermis culicivorax TaxID=13658 RepID=A0A915HGM5_ROMCU